MHGSAIWSPTLREEHELTMFNDRVLRRMLRPKEEDVVGGWKNMPNEALHNFYSSVSITRAIKSKSTGSAGHVE